MVNKENTKTFNSIQNWMQGMLIQHIPVSDLNVSTSDMVNASQRMSAEQHLSIYRQSYIARLRSCMQSQFKALSYALGEALFEAFVDEYLDSNPSASYSLNTLGEKFPAFLEQSRPDAESDEKEEWPDFMIELATFEYALTEIFDRPETANAVPDAHTPEDLLIASPTLHLFEHQFPICQYYLDFNVDLRPELPFSKQSHCAVSRQDYRLGLFNIGADQYHFLSYLKAGSNVAAAKIQLIETFHFDSDALEKIWPIWRKNFIASGFLACK